MVTADTIRQALQCDNPSCACHKPNGLVHCPAHDDTTPSLSVTEKDGKILVKDFGGCGQDRVIEALKEKGLWPSKNGDQPQAHKPRIVATYGYHDAAGKLIFQVCRKDNKEFPQRRPDGKGGWIWNLEGVDRVPYRLPELLKADIVYIPEGEKDVDRLRTLALTATCNPGGAGKWRADYAQHFKGKRAIILPDNDDPGRAHAQDIAGSLNGVAASVKILTLPGLPGKGDVSDWIEGGGTVGQLTALAETASEFAPDTEKKEATGTADPIALLTHDLTADTPTIDKIKGLSPLVPLLAKLSHLEAAAIIEELRERLKLRATDLVGLKADVKAARKSLEKKSKQDAPALALAELEDVRRCHLATDFLGGPVPQAMTYGFRVPLPDSKEGVLLVLSDGRGVRAEVNAESVKLEDVDYQITGGCPPLLEDVWTLAGIKSFVEAPTRPAGLYQDLVAAFKTYLDLQDPAAYGFMTAWTVGTYLTQIFAAVPFIHFYGPKETGKSKALETLRFSCFNAYKGRDITAAALGDTVDGMRGVVLIDQAERLGMVGKAGEGMVNLVGLLADSYKKAGGRRRVVEMSAGGRRVLEFSTFGFKGFASTKNLDPDLADRCIPIAMTRTGQRLPDLEGHEAVWGDLRDKCYRFALGAFRKVAAAYQATTGNGTRIAELWRPLAAVLTALDVGEVEFRSVQKFFMAKAEEARHVPDGWELGLLEALENCAQASPEFFEMTAGDLIEAMQVDSKEKPGAKWIGETLGKFSLFSKKGRVKRQGKKVTAYTFNRPRVLKIIEIFLQGIPQNDLSPLSSNENNNDSNGIQGTGQKSGTRPHLSPGDGNEGDRPGPVPIVGCVPQELYENTKELVEGTEGTGETGGMAEKKSSLFSGDEVDPLGGEI
ncbi:MAG: hypothetical protein Q7O12_14280 [Deltaproteobacteria bacterium]|nr:hypothetical protein [Deltaproteobacteria bacterium]